MNIAGTILPIYLSSNLTRNLALLKLIYQSIIQQGKSMLLCREASLHFFQEKLLHLVLTIQINHVIQMHSTQCRGAFAVKINKEELSVTTQIHSTCGRCYVVYSSYKVTRSQVFLIKQAENCKLVSRQLYPHKLSLLSLIIY